MTLIIISNPESVEGEFELVNALFEEGLEYFHLRKPGFNRLEMEAYIRNIKPSYVKRILLHSHHELVKKYNIGGFHFPSHYLQNEDQLVLKGLLMEAKKRGLRTGTSVHSLQEAKDLKGFDYYFLSPVFDSISKEGYKASLDLDEIKRFFQEHVTLRNKPERIALGGINENNAATLRDVGFSGVAVLGSIWKDYKRDDREKMVQKFRKLQSIMADE